MKDFERSFEIAHRRIGTGEAPYVIAELSGNHNGDISRAREIMKSAKDAGVDALKLQTYTADTITINHTSSEFTISSGPWAGKTLYELYSEASTPWEWHEELFEYGRKLGLTVFSSPFDATAVEFLESLDTPIYKIASFEIVDIPLIQIVAATGKPMIISTGMSNIEEISEAVIAAQNAGCNKIILLHCISGYPTPVNEANLRRMKSLEVTFGCPVGLSDHTLGTHVAVSAVAMGACMVEKHITLARSDGGPDAEFSLEPNEFAELVRGVQVAHVSQGTPDFGRTHSEVGNIIFRRSLYAVQDIAPGEKFTSDNVRSIRPGYGLPPKRLREVLNRRATTQIARGTALAENLLGDPS